MNLNELRKYLNIPRDATYHLVNNASFYPAKKIGKCWMIDEKKLRKWIDCQISGKENEYDGTKKRSQLPR